MKIANTSLSLVFWLLFAFAPVIHAEEPSADPKAAMQQEFDKALADLYASRQNGPADIPLQGQIILHLPSGYAFVPNPAAGKFMAMMGNQVDDGFMGLVMGDTGQLDWIVSLDFAKSGYIRDDDAKTWNVDDMLKSLRESAEEINENRASRGIPPLELQGWAEAPNYDAATHRLVWALTVNTKDAPKDQPASVNYNTYTLGREGYVSLNLVTSLNELAQRKPIAQQLLASLEFDPGKRYEDFNAETDHTAEYGLAALVGGAFAAKKLGLLAIAGVFVAKFGKLIAIGAAALFGIFGKRWKSKKAEGGGSMDA